MSSDDGYPLATLSDSSDDIGILSTYASQLPNQKKPQASVTSPATEVEPDWVRDYTPQTRTDQEQKDALLALLEDAEDDSIIDLLSEDGDDVVRPQTEEAAKGPKAENVATRTPKVFKLKSRLPLLVAPKLDESLVLLQSDESGLDLSGDVGAVGRSKVENGELFMDIKGVVYRGCVGKCNTMCVVTVGEDDARVTSVLDEVVTLKCERNLFASDEIVIHGLADESDTEGSDQEDEEGGGERGRKRRKKNEGIVKGKGKATAKGEDLSKKKPKAAESAKKTTKAASSTRKTTKAASSARKTTKAASARKTTKATPSVKKTTKAAPSARKTTKAALSTKGTTGGSKTPRKK